MNDLLNALQLYIQGGGGTSEFFSSTTEAYRFLKDNVISPNTNISEGVKFHYLEVLETLYGDAFNQFGESENGALFLWDSFGEYVLATSSDEGLLAVFSSAQKATEAQKEFNENKDKAFDAKEIKNNIPTWIYIVGALALYRVIKK